jgi:hypothetical protein
VQGVNRGLLHATTEALLVAFTDSVAVSFAPLGLVVEKRGAKTIAPLFQPEELRTTDVLAEIETDSGRHRKPIKFVNVVLVVETDRHLSVENTSNEIRTTTRAGGIQIPRFRKYWKTCAFVKQFLIRTAALVLLPDLASDIGNP